SLMSDLDTWIAPGIIVWFVQSKNIRVRLNVVAWAFSVLVGLIFLLWLWIYFIGHQGAYNPPQSLFGLLTGKSKLYVNGAGNSNYLIPYRHDDSSLPGLVRFVSFFHGPESFALVTGFVSLLALDLKNRAWSFTLLSSAIVLLLLSGTRSAWIAFAIVFCIWYLIKVGKTGSVIWLCAALAAVTFTVFCVPPVTNLVLGTVQNTAQTTAELRADSTEVRAEIYRQTLDGISNSPESKFWLGHVIEGETVLPGYEPATVGSHSFYLGSLLYRQGIVGTIIFAVFWGSWVQWLYRTKTDRCLASFLIIVLFSVTFCVMAFESTIMPILLISAVIYRNLETSDPQKKLLHT
ncbi:MAG: O-antigen ligase family protein, partial [Thermosynechococcaceae cyanobacterium]